MAVARSIGAWGEFGVGMDEREPLIFIVSGEASGDHLAGRLMAALKRETGGRIRFAGVGGPQSERQGLDEPVSHERSVGDGASPRCCPICRASSGASTRRPRRRSGSSPMRW